MFDRKGLAEALHNLHAREHSLTVVLAVKGEAQQANQKKLVQHVVEARGGGKRKPRNQETAIGDRQIIG